MLDYLLKVILYSYLILKKMNEHITVSLLKTHGLSMEQHFELIADIFLDIYRFCCQRWTKLDKEIQTTHLLCTSKECEKRD